MTDQELQEKFPTVKAINEELKLPEKGSTAFGHNGVTLNLEKDITTSSGTRNN